MLTLCFRALFRSISEYALMSLSLDLHCFLTCHQYVTITLFSWFIEFVGFIRGCAISSVSQWPQFTPYLVFYRPCQGSFSVADLRLCVGGWRGGGGGGGGGGGSLPIYGIIRMCVPNSPFFSIARYIIGPQFSTKSIWMARFFRIPMWKAPFFDILVYAHIFRSEIFRDCLSSWYYMNWLWYLCNNQQKWVQKFKGQYMNRSTFWMIKYMNGSVFSKARYMNGGGFEFSLAHPYQNYP